VRSLPPKNFLYLLRPLKYGSISISKFQDHAEREAIRQITSERVQDDRISKQLQVDLFDWRDEKAITKFPQAHVKDFGGGLLLSDQHIQHILQCASCHKLSNIEALLKETHWRKDWADELGESLLSVIHKHYPLPSLPTEPTAGPSNGPRGPMKCSKCHEIGHNGKFDFSPL
jgi:hypothetical protein